MGSSRPTNKIMLFKFLRVFRPNKTLRCERRVRVDRVCTAVSVSLEGAGKICRFCGFIWVETETQYSRKKPERYPCGTKFLSVVEKILKWTQHSRPFHSWPSIHYWFIYSASNTTWEPLLAPIRFKVPLQSHSRSWGNRYFPLCRNRNNPYSSFASAGSCAVEWSHQSRKNHADVLSGVWNSEVRIGPF